MCPLFAAQGSIWTGTQNGLCLRAECGWWQGGRCIATEYAGEGLVDAARTVPPRTFECPHAAECQWQLQSKGLCPPRLALSQGKNPNACQY